VPAINWTLFAAVAIVTVGFGSSARLATAYGVAVTGTFMINTILFLAVASALWHWGRWKLVVAGAVFLGVEVTFFAANLTKVVHGGWLPLLIAFGVFTVMVTWQRGREIVTANRIAKEGPLREFVDKLHHSNLPRVRGTAVFPHPSSETTPFALRANVEHNHVVHEHVVIVTAVSENVPHVVEDRISIDDLGYRDDGIVHVTVRYGFQDYQDIPAALREACAGGASGPELDINPDEASYFVSKVTLQITKAPGMSMWRKRLFLGLANNASNPAEYFGLPEPRVVVMGSQVDI
jgi:KUP system potassium uptake protein